MNIRAGSACGSLFLTLFFLSIVAIPAQETSQFGELPLRTVDTQNLNVPDWESSSGRNELYALARAYPGRISKYEYRLGDWAVLIDDTWFYWARGRMLPESLRSRWAEFQSYRFYDYPPGLPELRILKPEEGKALSARVSASDENPPKRSELFLGTLLHATDLDEALDQLESVWFLGLEIEVHRIVAPSLARVEEDLKRLFKRDVEARTFFDGIRLAGGFNYRSIAGQGSRSYHSYGLAIDFIPKSYDGRFPYWRWAYDSGIDDWWELTYEKRWMVPMSVVAIFEHHGFVWGGKWLFFDALHFEYRPEVILLSRLALLPGI